MQALVYENNIARLAATKLLSSFSPRAFVGPLAPLQLRDIPAPRLNVGCRVTRERQVAEQGQHREPQCDSHEPPAPHALRGSRVGVHVRQPPTQGHECHGSSKPRPPSIKGIKQSVGISHAAPLGLDGRLRTRQRILAPYPGKH